MNSNSQHSYAQAAIHNQNMNYTQPLDNSNANILNSNSFPSPPSTSLSTSSSHFSLSKLPHFYRSFSNLFQHYLDQSTPHTTGRYVFLLSLILIYCVRVYYLQGFYIVTYGLGIFLLNLLIGFLSPLDEDLLESERNSSANNSSDSILPTDSTTQSNSLNSDSNSDSAEFKPFIRRLPEFKFWFSCTKSILIAFSLTFFSLFDIPVFWPILLIYFCILFFLTMKRQIKHMMKFKYIPFNLGKKRYKGGQGSSNSGGNNTAKVTSSYSRNFGIGIAEDIRSR